MTDCKKCAGRRVVVVHGADGMNMAVSCGHCAGTGVEPEHGSYYVIWFNRRTPRIELHAAFCAHELFTKANEYENIGADRGDLREALRDLYEQHKPYSVQIEDCLR